MNKRNVILFISAIAVIFVSFLIYVVPYGKKVKLFDLKFVDFKNKTNNNLEILNATNLLSSFNNSLDEMTKMSSELNKLREELNNLKTEENFINTIWSKSSITDSDIALINKDVFNIYNNLPRLVSLVIEKSCRLNTDEALRSTSIDNLTTQFSNLKVSIETLYTNLGKVVVSNDFKAIKITFDNLEVDKKL